MKLDDVYVWRTLQTVIFTGTDEDIIFIFMIYFCSSRIVSRATKSIPCLLVRKIRCASMAIFMVLYFRGGLLSVFSMYEFLVCSLEPE